MTNLHEVIKSYCESYSLFYPDLISMKEQEYSKEFIEDMKNRFFEMGANPYFVHSLPIYYRSSCIPETYQQRRSRILRRTMQILTGGGVIGASTNANFVIINSCFGSGVFGKKWYEVEIIELFF